MRLGLALPLILAVLAPFPLAAQGLSREEQATLNPISEYHYDQVFRENGFEAYKRGDMEWARKHFLSAARYADKTSQLALSTIYANGAGVSRDLALAYAWADLAAERGFPKFVARREQLWAMLDADGQARAIEEGGKLYAEYGDAVAKAAPSQPARPRDLPHHGPTPVPARCGAHLYVLGLQRHAQRGRQRDWGRQLLRARLLRGRELGVKRLLARAGLGLGRRQRQCRRRAAAPAR